MIKNIIKMKRIAIIAALLIGTFTVTKASADVDHNIWDKLLRTHVSTTGKVDYKGFVKDKDKVDQYLQILSKTNVAELSKEERLAFWINAYNAFMVDLVIKNYPVKTVRDIKGSNKAANAVRFGVFKDKLRYKVGGLQLDLETMEKEVLLKQNFDARIHFAIVCASFSCPRLYNEAYTGAKLEKQLEIQAKNFINDITKNNIMDANKAQLSKLFDWYKDDFTKVGGSVIGYINKYAITKLNPKAKLSYFEYNWNLNE